MVAEALCALKSTTAATSFLYAPGFEGLPVSAAVPQAASVQSIAVLATLVGCAFSHCYLDINTIYAFAACQMFRLRYMEKGTGCSSRAVRSCFRLLAWTPLRRLTGGKLRC